MQTLLWAEGEVCGVVCGDSGSCVRLMMIGGVFVCIVGLVVSFCVFSGWLVGSCIWFVAFVVVVMEDPNCGGFVILGTIGVLSFPSCMCLVALVEFWGGKGKVSVLPTSFVLGVFGEFGWVSYSIIEGLGLLWGFGLMGVVFGVG